MKKIFKAFVSVILAIILSVGSAFSVLTATISSGINETIVTLDIVWSDISFTYDAGTATWHPSSHSYQTDGYDAAWRDDSGKIAFYNYSNTAISIEVLFKSADVQNGTATLKISNSSFTLANTLGANNVSYITADGVPTSGAAIGKIVVFVNVIHTHKWNNGACLVCGEICEHNIVNGICSICGFNTIYERENDVIYFGEYPQTVKNRYVTVSDTPDSRGYYLGSDNEYYARVVATPYESGYTFSSDASITSGQEYYFKVEPIKWRIISENNGTAVLLCESIIASRRYDDLNNNYAESEIREWLNDSFYNTAFNNLEKSIIHAISVDNSVASTGYSENSNTCENTVDNIYLLSHIEAISLDKSLRAKNVSDYARASGALISTSYLEAHNGNGLWMLRTPNDAYTHFISECNYNGDISDGGTNVSSKFFGVAPALTIKL